MATVTKKRKAPRKLTRARTSKPTAPGRWNTINVEEPAAKVRVTPDSSLSFTAVYAAVGLIASTIGMLPIRLLKKTDDGGREHLRDDPIQSLVSRTPNGEQTPVMFWEYIASSMALYGNAYAEIVFDQRANPIALWTLPPDRVVVKRDNAGALVYEYTPEMGPKAALRADNVLHCALFGDGIVGKSPIRLAREAISEGIAAQRFSAALFGNGVKLSGVLMHPEHIGEEGTSNLRKELERHYAGASNAGKIMILEEGMTFQSISMPLKDAQFIESRGFNLREVARLFGVPPFLLQDTTDMHYNNIEHLAIAFVQYTLMRYISRIEQELTRKLLSRTETRIVFKVNVDGLLRGDMKTRFEAYGIARQWGLKNANECRRLEDQNPLPGEQGETFFMPANMLPVEKMLADEPPVAAPDAEPDDVAEAARAAFADVAARLVFRELKDVRKLTRTAWTAQSLGEFYRDAIPRVAESMLPVLRVIAKLERLPINVPDAARRFCELSRDSMAGLLAEGDGVDGLNLKDRDFIKRRADLLTRQWFGDKQ